MAFMRCANGSSGTGDFVDFTTAKQVTVPARSYYTITASNVKRVMLTIFAVNEVSLWDFSGGTNYLVQNGTVTTNPQYSQSNQYATYANGVITIQSNSGQDRGALVMWG